MRMHGVTRPRISTCPVPVLQPCATGCNGWGISRTVVLLFKVSRPASRSAATTHSMGGRRIVVWTSGYCRRAVRAGGRAMTFALSRVAIASNPNIPSMPPLPFSAVLCRERVESPFQSLIIPRSTARASSVRKHSMNSRLSRATVASSSARWLSLSSRLLIRSAACG